MKMLLQLRCKSGGHAREDAGQEGHAGRQVCTRECGKNVANLHRMAILPIQKCVAILPKSDGHGHHATPKTWPNPEPKTRIKSGPGFPDGQNGHIGHQK